MQTEPIPTFSSLLRDLELMEREDLRPEASGLSRELAIDMALADNDNTGGSDG